MKGTERGEDFFLTSIPEAAPHACEDSISDESYFDDAISAAAPRSHEACEDAVSDEGCCFDAMSEAAPRGHAVITRTVSDEACVFDTISEAAPHGLEACKGAISDEGCYFDTLSEAAPCGRDACEADVSDEGYFDTISETAPRGLEACEGADNDEGYYFDTISDATPRGHEACEGVVGEEGCYFDTVSEATPHDHKACVGAESDEDHYFDTISEAAPRGHEACEDAVSDEDCYFDTISEAVPRGHEACESSVSDEGYYFDAIFEAAPQGHEAIEGAVSDDKLTFWSSGKDEKLTFWSSGKAAARSHEVCEGAVSDESYCFDAISEAAPRGHEACENAVSDEGYYFDAMSEAAPHGHEACEDAVSAEGYFFDTISEAAPRGHEACEGAAGDEGYYFDTPSEATPRGHKACEGAVGDMVSVDATGSLGLVIGCLARGSREVLVILKRPDVGHSVTVRQECAERVALVDRASRDFSAALRRAYDCDGGNRLFPHMASAALLGLSGCGAPNDQEDLHASSSFTMVLAVFLVVFVAARLSGHLLLLAIGRLARTDLLGATDASATRSASPSSDCSMVQVAVVAGEAALVDNQSMRKRRLVSGASPHLFVPPDGLEVLEPKSTDASLVPLNSSQERVQGQRPQNNVKSAAAALVPLNSSPKRSEARSQRFLHPSGTSALGSASEPSPGAAALQFRFLHPSEASFQIFLRHSAAHQLEVLQRSAAPALGFAFETSPGATALSLRMLHQAEESFPSFLERPAASSSGFVSEVPRPSAAHALEVACGASCSEGARWGPPAGTRAGDAKKRLVLRLAFCSNLECANDEVGYASGYLRCLAAVWNALWHILHGNTATGSPMQAEPAAEPPVPPMPAPSAQDAPLLLHVSPQVPDFSGHLVSPAMTLHQDGMLLTHVVDRLAAQSRGQVHVLTASINAALASFQVAPCPRGPHHLYQNIADLIEHVSGDVANTATQPVILAWGVAPSQVESLAHKLAVLAMADIAHVPLISAVDVPVQDVTSDVSLISHVQVHFGSNLAVASRAIMCLSPVYGRQAPHGRGLQYLRKLLVQFQPASIVARGRLAQPSYDSMPWVRSPVPLLRQSAVQFRITVPVQRLQWIRDKVSHFQAALQAENSVTKVITLAPSQVRRTLGKFMPKHFRTMAFHVAPLAGQALWLLKRLHAEVLQAGFGFWYDFADACPTDVAFSPITVGTEEAVFAVSTEAAAWARDDSILTWDFPHKGWLMLADPTETALRFTESLRSAEDKLTRFRKPMNWRLETRIALYDDTGLDCSIWQVTQLNDPMVAEYQLSPLTPGDVLFLQEERKSLYPRSSASFTPACVLDADGRQVGAAVLRIRLPELQPQDDFHTILQSCLQQGVFDWRRVRCEISHYTGCSQPTSSGGSHLLSRDICADIWAWDARARPGDRAHMRLPPMLRLHPMPDVAVAGREHGHTTLPCTELRPFFGTSAVGLQLPVSLTPHAVESPMLAYATDHPPDLPWRGLCGAPESAEARMSGALRSLGHETVGLASNHPFMKAVQIGMQRHSLVDRDVDFASRSVVFSIAQRNVPRNVLHRLPSELVEALVLWLPGQEGVTLGPLEDSSYASCSHSESGAFPEAHRYEAHVHAPRRLLVLTTPRGWMLRRGLLQAKLAPEQHCEPTWTGRAILGYILKSTQRAPQPQQSSRTFQAAYAASMASQHRTAPGGSTTGGPGGTTGGTAGSAAAGTAGHGTGRDGAGAAPAPTAALVTGLPHAAIADAARTSAEPPAADDVGGGIEGSYVHRPACDGVPWRSMEELEADAEADLSDHEIPMNPDLGTPAMRSGEATAQSQVPPRAISADDEWSARGPADQGALPDQDRNAHDISRVVVGPGPGPTRGAAASQVPTANGPSGRTSAQIGCCNDDATLGVEPALFRGDAAEAGWSSAMRDASSLDHRQNAATVTGAASAAGADVGPTTARAAPDVKVEVADARSYEGQRLSTGAQLRTVAEECREVAGAVRPAASCSNTQRNYASDSLPQLPDSSRLGQLRGDHAFARTSGNEVQEEVARNVSAFLGRPMTALSGTEGACLLRSLVQMLSLPPRTAEGLHGWQVVWYLICTAWLSADVADDAYANEGALVQLHDHPFWRGAILQHPILRQAAVLIYQAEGIRAQCLPHAYQYSTDVQVREATRLVQRFYGHQVLVVNTTVDHLTSVDSLEGVMQPGGQRVADPADVRVQPFILLRFYDHYITGCALERYIPRPGVDSWWRTGSVELHGLLRPKQEDQFREAVCRWLLTRLTGSALPIATPLGGSANKRPLCIWSLCGRGRIWEPALRLLGENWVVAVEAEADAATRAIVATHYGLPLVPSANMYRKSDGRLVAYPGDLHTLLCDGGRPVKRLLKHCPANALHLLIQAAPSGDLCRRLQGEIGFCGSRGVLVHCGFFLHELLREHVPDTALVVAVHEFPADLRQRPLFAKYVSDLVGGDLTYVDTGDEDLVSCQRAWVSPFGAASVAHNKAAHSALDVGWVPLGTIIKDAIDVVSSDLGADLRSALQDSPLVRSVGIPYRIGAAVPDRFRCQLHWPEEDQQTAQRSSGIMFAGHDVPLRGRQVRSADDLSILLIDTFGVEGSGRNWRAVPARCNEGSLPPTTVPPHGCLPDGSLLFDFSSYQDRSLLRPCDSMGEPLPVDWVAFDEDFHGARLQLNAIAPGAGGGHYDKPAVRTAVRAIHQQAAAGAVRVRPVSLQERVRLVGLDIDSSDFNGAHMLSLISHTSPVTQLARVLRGAGEDRSLDAVLQGRWAPPSAPRISAAQLWIIYQDLLHAVRSKPTSRSPFARVASTPLPQPLWEEYLTSTNAWHVPCNEGAGALEPVPVVSASSLAVRASRAVSTVQPGHETSVKRESASQSSSRSVAARIGGQRPVPESPRRLPPPSSGDPILDAQLRGFQHGREFDCSMQGLIHALGHVLGVAHLGERLPVVHAWCRVRYPTLWERKLFGSALSFQCWVAMHLWRVVDVPSLIVACCDDSGCVVDPRSLLEGSAQTALLLCVWCHRSGCMFGQVRRCVTSLLRRPWCLHRQMA